MRSGLAIIRRLSELLEERERKVAEAGEWKFVDWRWRQQWRAEAARIGWELDRLGKGMPRAR